MNVDRPEDTVKEACSLWAEREQRRSEILAIVYKSEASLVQGKGRRVTTYEDVKKLVDDVKQRGTRDLPLNARLPDCLRAQ